MQNNRKRCRDASEASVEEIEDGTDAMQVKPHEDEDLEGSSVDQVLSNEDLLKLIFKRFDVVQLCRIARTGRTWWNASFDPEHWTDLRLSDQHAITQRQVENITSRHGRNVLRLTLSGKVFDYRSHPDQALSNSLRFLTRLQGLLVDHVSFTNRSLFRSPAPANKHLPHLSHLVLTSCDLTVSFPRNTQPEGGGLPGCYINHPGLKVIEIVGCHFPHGLHINTAHCLRLKLRHSHTSDLTIHLMPRLQIMDLGFLTGPPESHVRRSLRGLTSMTRLCLEKVFCITNDTIRELSPDFTSLLHIDLRACNVSLDAIRNLPSLQVAVMNGCLGVTSWALNQTLDLCSSLEEIHLDGCEGLKTVEAHPGQGALGPSRLRLLSLRSCPNLSHLKLTSRSLREVRLGYLPPYCPPQPSPSQPLVGLDPQPSFQGYPMSGGGGSSKEEAEVGQLMRVGPWDPSHPLPPPPTSPRVAVGQDVPPPPHPAEEAAPPVDNPPLHVPLIALPPPAPAPVPAPAQGGGQPIVVHFPGGLGQHLAGLGLGPPFGDFDQDSDDDDDPLPLAIGAPNPNPAAAAAAAIAGAGAGGGGGEAGGGGHVVPRGVYGIEGCKSLSSICLRCDSMRSIEWCNLPALSHLELDCPSLTSLCLSECDQITDELVGNLILPMDPHFRGSQSSQQDDEGFPSVVGGGGGRGRGEAGPSSSSTKNPPTVYLSSPLPRLLELRLEHCQGLRSLTLGPHPSLSRLLLNGCPRMQTVKLQGQALTVIRFEGCEELTRACLLDMGVQELKLGSCTSLTSLHVSGSRVARLDLQGCIHLQKLRLWCPALEFLDATFCTQVDDFHLEDCLSSCPPLKTLVLSACTLIGTATSHNSLSSSIYRADSEMNRGLWPGHSSHDDRAVALAMAAATSMGKKTRVLASALSQLMPSNGALPTSPSSSYGSTLTHLDLSYTHVDDLSPLCLPCPNIVTLNLSSCTDLDPKSVMKIIGGGEIDHPPMDHDQGCKGEGEALLPRLRHLDVSYCSGLLTSDYVPRLVLHGGKKLLSLSINGCKDVKDATWQSIFSPDEAVPDPLPLALETLSLKQCLGIKLLTLTPDGRFGNLLSLRLALSSIERVQISHQMLNDLDLNVCGKLVSMELLCPAMIKISMQSCRLIKAKSLMLDCLSSCPRLQSLDLKNCSEEVRALVNDVARGSGDLCREVTNWEHGVDRASDCEAIQALLRRLPTLIL